MCMVSGTRLDHMSTLYRELIVGIGASGTQGETALRLDLTATSMFVACSGPSQGSARLNRGAKIRNVQPMWCEQCVVVIGDWEVPLTKRSHNPISRVLACGRSPDLDLYRFGSNGTGTR